MQPQQVLFLCTGNYYRSRHAEHYFNWQAQLRQLPWQAFSRGLALTPVNVGPISSYTRQRLRQLTIPLPEPVPLPQPLAAADLTRAQHIVAVKEAEHRPLLQRHFPDWLEHVEFWHIHDIDCDTPDSALPLIENHVDALIERLNKLHHSPQPPFSSSFK